MAKYSVELRDIVESGVKLFNFAYPFYNETKRADFEQRFIDHFYFREIGVETTGRFLHYLKVKCNERLPYYNELLNMTAMEYDVLKPYNITEELSKTNSNNRELDAETIQNGSVNGHSTTTNDIDKTNDITITENKTNTAIDNNKIVESDTPNGLLSMTDIKGNVYASKANIEEAENTTTNNSTLTNKDATQENTTSETENTDIMDNTSNTTQNETISGKEDYTLTRKGHIGVQTASELLLKHIELQSKIRTFYTQFFNECEDLFMQIY